MATNFPTSLDSFTNPTSTDGLDNPSHSSQHANINDAVEALETKIGVDNSDVTTSVDYRLTQAIADTSFGYISGAYYAWSSPSYTITNSTSVLSRVTFSPFFCDQTQTFDRIAVSTHTSFTGSTTVRIGIYNNSNRAPTTVLLDAGTVVCTASNTIYSITINQTLRPGYYWLASVAQVISSGTSTFYTLATPNMTRSGAMSSTSLGSYVYETWKEEPITGAFATAGTLTRQTPTRVVALRAA